MTYDYIIIGAGVTGITLCKKLRENGKRVIILEKNSNYGGLCITKNINGHILDIGGGHFFHTKYQEVFDYIFKYIPESEFNYINRVSKIEIEGQTVDYPLESNIWQLSTEKCIEYIISIIRNGESQDKPQPQNYEQWIRWKLGDKICDKYMIPYNEKLWGVEPHEMDVDWLYKIPRVNVNEILKYCIERKQDKSKFPAHINFYYPKRGGFQSIVDAIAKDEIPYIVFNQKVNDVKFFNGQIIINKKYSCLNLINTAPWCELYDAFGSVEFLKNDFENIKCNKIVVSLYEKDYTHDWHWRYIPDKKKNHHREFYISNFAKDSKNNGVYLETNINRYNGEEKTFGGKMICSYTTDYAYPIPVIGSSQAIENILNYYKQKNVFGVGRWGQHQYQNADVSIYNALQFVKNHCI